MTMLTPHSIGEPPERVESVAKVTGAAKYAFEYDVQNAAYGWLVGSTVAHGIVRAVDVEAARAEPGVLDVVWHGNAARLAEVDDAELHVLQSPQIVYYGQPVAVVVAASLETARAGALNLRVDIEE